MFTVDSSPTPPLREPELCLDWRSLVGHAEAVQAEDPTDEVFDRFKNHRHEFMAVLEGARPIGICARREIGMLLGGRYGYAIYARRPIRAHLSADGLCISLAMPVAAVLGAVFSREAACFYDDVILVTEEDVFLGLIPVHALVRLQTTLLEGHVRQLQEKRHELADRNEQMETDLALAREMQLALLPTAFPSFPPSAVKGEGGLNFSHVYRPSSAVSGDFFHVVPLDEGRAGIFICDVMGHGVRSALVTAMVRVLLQDGCSQETEAGHLLARINRGLMAIIPHEAGLMFVTAAYAIVDLESQTIQYASAGHPPALRLNRHAGSALPLPVPRGDFNPAVGIFPQASFHTYTQPLEDGEVILFYTDGLFEVPDLQGDPLGIERVIDCVQTSAGTPLGALPAGILTKVRALTATDFDDDVCLLAAEFRSPAGFGH